MTSLAGCVLPVGPRFEGPPDEQNFAPVITYTSPAQGLIVTATGVQTPTMMMNLSQTFTITVTDPNVQDDLYVRWIGEYPPYSNTSHVMGSDLKLSHSLNGQPLQSTTSYNVTCFSLLAPTPQHAITVLVSDRPFWDPSDPKAPTSVERLLTENTQRTQTAQANWQLNLSCQ